MVLEPLGFSIESDEFEDLHVTERFQLANVDEAIRIVSTKFSTEVVFYLLWHPSALILHARRLDLTFTKPFVQATPRLWTLFAKPFISFQ